MIQTTIAAVLATVAVFTYVTRVRDDQRALATRVYVEEQHLGIEDRSLEARVFNDGPAPIRFVGVAAFGAGRRRRLWRIRRSQQDWWTGERFAGRFFPLIKAGGKPKVDWGGIRWDGSRLAFPPVIIVFTDGNGRRWVRWPDGRLSREFRRFRQADDS